MEKILQAWKLGMIQDAVNMHDHLVAHGKTFEDVREHLSRATKYVAADVKAREEWLSRLPKCPDCEAPLNPYPINTSPGNQVGGSFKSMWMCSKWCGYEKYNNTTVQEELKKHDLHKE